MSSITPTIGIQGTPLTEWRPKGDPQVEPIAHWLIMSNGQKCVATWAWTENRWRLGNEPAFLPAETLAGRGWRYLAPCGAALNQAPGIGETTRVQAIMAEARAGGRIDERAACAAALEQFAPDLWQELNRRLGAARGIASLKPVENDFPQTLEKFRPGDGGRNDFGGED